ncbi:glycosyltransferase family 4 protein [Methylobacterium terricola]|uniref:Glycosyltransferase family 4 protein n=1 Tax=Methylobacterium terricola TaxID=2583531 RepID=A0A5C4LDV0_9HYPH|nr:glycosyltransferase [Methylobacterium terricola]TNC11464.1 glycosyltransferase family 4 protein [Methylobacterium terricola]
MSKLIVFTCFDTIVFFDEKTQKIAHASPDGAPLNLEVQQSGSSVNVSVMGAPSFDTRIVFEKCGGGNRFTIRFDGALLTALPNGSFSSDAGAVNSWEVFYLFDENRIRSRLFWHPDDARGGTELMLTRLKNHLGGKFDEIDICLNRPTSYSPDRPCVVWMHNEPQTQYEWCEDTDIVGRIAAFVFVSQWQREAFCKKFVLPLDKCHVIKNGIDQDYDVRAWPQVRPWRWRCAYISAPYRGLKVLLDAWSELAPDDAQLDVWSSMKLWGNRYNDGDAADLFSQMKELKNVTYNGIAPNSEIRRALKDMHFLLYPCTFDETSCLSVIEAMSSGCRVIAPARAALTETTAGFARLHGWSDNHNITKEMFKRALIEEFQSPWSENFDTCVHQQEYFHRMYDMKSQALEWSRLIDHVMNETRSDP